MIFVPLILHFQKYVYSVKRLENAKHNEFILFLLKQKIIKSIGLAKHNRENNLKTGFKYIFQDIHNFGNFDICTFLAQGSFRYKNMTLKYT